MNSLTFSFLWRYSPNLDFGLFRTTRNYSALADLRTLQITTSPAKPFLPRRVLTSRSLATSSNSKDFHLAALQSFFQSHPFSILTSSLLTTTNYQPNYRTTSSQPAFQTLTLDCQPQHSLNLSIIFSSPGVLII
jgi:hypothetical protein